MKILHLHFRNINSLAGEFSIDFTHPSLAEAGVFTITGPTGAGKTTILDALSYALYGQTPRQKDISHSANEIMSRKASDCEATVVFESDNRCYRVSASHSRRKARASTKDPKPFAEPKRSLEILGDDNLWHPLETQTQGVRRRVKELSGLSFENFKRCMMLPQGDFENFLKANDKDRSEVLSTITGTDIYLKIGEYVHQKISDLEKDLSAYREGEVLSNEERLKLQESCNQARMNLRQYRKEQRELAELLSWLDDVEKAQRAAVAAQAEWQAAQQELCDFEADGRLRRMELGLRAAKVKTAEDACRRLSRQHREAEETLSSLEDYLTQLMPRLEEAASAHHKAEQQLETEDGKLQEEQRRIEQRLRPMETKRDTLSAQTDSALKAMEDAKQHADRAKADAVRARQLHELALQSTALARQKLDSLLADKALPAALSGIEQAWRQCAPYRELGTGLMEESTDGVRARLQHLDLQLGEALGAASIEQRAITITKLHKLADLESALTDSEKKLQKLTQQVGQARNLLETLPSLEASGHRVQQAQEAYDLISHQAPIEEKLELLYWEFREGKRDCCPCCGATTCSERHPLPGNALADADLRCRRARADHQQLALRHNQTHKTLQEAEAELRAEQQQQQSRQEEYQTLICLLKLPDSRPGTSELISREEAQLQKLRTWQQEQQKLQALIPALQARDAFNASILPFTAAAPRSFEEALTCLTDLQVRSKKYTKSEQSLQAALQEQTKAKLHAGASQQQHTEKQQALQNSRQTYEELRQQLCDLCASIEHEWGTASATERITAVNHQRDSLRQAEKTTHDKLITLQADQKKQQGQLEQQRQLLRILTRNLQKSSEDFRTALKEHRFENQSAYFDAEPFIAESEELQQQHLQRTQTLGARQAAAEVRLQHLHELRTRHTCALPRQDIQQRLNECSIAEQNAEEQLQHLTAALSVDDHQREANSLARQQAAPIRDELEHWRQLYTVLGGTRDSFLRYAQIITFQLLVRHANIQLAELNDRYTLVPDPRNPLQLSIIDSYQDDAPRSCSNLSGGESFIVSLALSLGLSHMAGDTRIDTLFLDEGFGTLDHDTLDNVMNCLQTLRQKGRLIGIITHVEQLKEYIPHGISVIPTGREGYSSLAPHPAITIRPSR